MARIIVVTSGKGGVGKTTTAANFATGLALRGKKTVVVDVDIGLRHLDLVLGCERRVVYDFLHVLQGEASLRQALIKDKNTEDLYILAASQTKDKDALTQEGVEKILMELSESFDYIVCDSPAGIEKGAQLALYFADDAIVVTNPEISAVRDADRMLGFLSARTKKALENLEPVKEYLLVTRYIPKRAKEGGMLSIDDVKELLRVPLIGVIPESEAVLQSSNAGKPVVHFKEETAGEAYIDMVARYLGEDRPLKFIDEKASFLKRLLGGA